MKDEIKSELALHMRELGLHMIGKGLVNATFAEILFPYNQAMAIIHIGHGAELIIKARIAEEHPLLIFSSIPKSSSSVESKLGIIDLLEKGQTFGYAELPERLWAVTGDIVPGIDVYNKFGKLRNQIIHLAVPDERLADIALSFGFGVLEKLVNMWWDETLLSYAVSYDTEYLFYVFEQLDRLNIEINYRNDGYDIIKK